MNETNLTEAVPAADPPRQNTIRCHAALWSPALPSGLSPPARGSPSLPAAAPGAALGAGCAPSRNKQACGAETRAAVPGNASGHGARRREEQAWGDARAQAGTPWLCTAHPRAAKERSRAELALGAAKRTGISI